MIIDVRPFVPASIRPGQHLYKRLWFTHSSGIWIFRKLSKLECNQSHCDALENTLRTDDRNSTDVQARKDVMDVT